MHVERQHACHQPGRTRGDKLSAGGLNRSGPPYVIRVVVRDQNPSHGLARQRPRQKRLPHRTTLLPVEPGVHDRPGIALIEDVDVLMVERHGERKPRPKDALGHLLYVARLGSVSPGKLQSVRRDVHHAARSSADTANTVPAPARA